MTIDINELRRLTQEATPGPWKMLPVGDGRQKFAVADSEFLSILTVTDEGGATFGTVYDDADAKFIAAANPAAINELLDRLEAAEKDIALKERVIDSLGLGLNAAAHERDALRALVVMRFDHDYPPQFTQGHDLHALAEPVTAEHCRWFVAEIERLRTDCDALREKIACRERQEPVARMDRNGTLYNTVSHVLASDKPLYLAPGAHPAPSGSSVKDAIIDDLQSQYDTEGITEHDSGDALIRLSDAIAAVRDNFAQPAPSVPVDLITDYLVSISAHVAHQDDPKAQAEIGELLRILTAAPEAKP